MSIENHENISTINDVQSNFDFEALICYVVIGGMSSSNKPRFNNYKCLEIDMSFLFMTQCKHRPRPTINLVKVVQYFHHLTQAIFLFFLTKEMITCFQNYTYVVINFKRDTMKVKHFVTFESVSFGCISNIF